MYALIYISMDLIIIFLLSGDLFIRMFYIFLKKYFEDYIMLLTNFSVTAIFSVE